jgi:hypothetical protein
MTNLKVTKHAAERMAERKITWQEVARVLASGTTRVTPHGKVTKVGWFSTGLDAEFAALSGIHVVWKDRTIVTVYRS